MIKFAVGVIAYYVYTALAKNKEEYKLFPVVTAGAVAELVMEIIFSPIGYRITKRWKEKDVGREYLDFIGGGKK